MRAYLDFEKPVAELEKKLAELKSVADSGNHQDITDDVVKLEGKAQTALKALYGALTPW